MARPFSLLRSKLAYCELTNELLARELLITPSTVSRKLNNHSPWTSEEMWQIMALINEPPHMLHRIFPANGQNEPDARRAKERRTA